MSLASVVILLQAVLSLLSQPGMAENQAVQGLAFQAIQMAHDALDNQAMTVQTEDMTKKAEGAPSVPVVPAITSCTVKAVVRGLTPQEIALHKSMGLSVPSHITDVQWTLEGLPDNTVGKVYANFNGRWEQVGGLSRTKEGSRLAGNFPHLKADFNGTICEVTP